MRVAAAAVSVLDGGCRGKEATQVVFFGFSTVLAFGRSVTTLSAESIVSGGFQPCDCSWRVILPAFCSDVEDEVRISCKGQ